MADLIRTRPYDFNNQGSKSLPPRPFPVINFIIFNSRERLGKELRISKRQPSRTESTGRMFLPVLITRRSSVQI